MNRFLKSIIVFLCVFASTSLVAQNVETTKSQIAKGVTLEHSTIPNMLYCNDRLFINVDNKPSIIFDSEGRAIKQVFPLDYDADGKTEYLISMDCGGSAAIYDLAIIKEKNGDWTAVWEDSFSQPTISINKNNSIKIEYFENINDVVSKEVAILKFSAGKIVKEKSQIKNSAK